MHEVETLAREAVDCGLQLHRRLGPGLLESAYEALLCESLRQRGLEVTRQRSIDAKVDTVVLKDAFRVDLLIENIRVIEIKSVDRFPPVHAKQLLTYLRLMDLPLGL